MRAMCWNRRLNSRRKTVSLSLLRKDRITAQEYYRAAFNAIRQARRASNPVPLYSALTVTTYARLRQNLVTVLNSVADYQEIVIVRRKGAKDALVPAAELAG
jgi:hypothetical protein